VRKQRGAQTPEARVVIVTAPGQEAQVDYAIGPMMRDPESRKCRRTRLFVMTLAAVANRKLPLTAAEDLLEMIMRRYERATMLTSKSRWKIGANCWAMRPTVPHSTGYRTTGMCSSAVREAVELSWTCPNYRRLT
jgi:hypothetical protein